MLGVEEARHVEIGADVLDHDVRRVAPAADRDVAIGQGEAFERGAIGAAHDFDAGARRVGEAGGVDRFGAGEIGAQSVAASRRWPVWQRSPSCERRDARVRRCRCRARSRFRAIVPEQISRRSSRAARWPRRRWPAERRPGRRGAEQGRGGDAGRQARQPPGGARSSDRSQVSTPIRQGAGSLGLDDQAIAVNPRYSERARPGVAGPPRALHSLSPTRTRPP